MAYNYGPPPPPPGPAPPNNPPAGYPATYGQSPYQQQQPQPAAPQRGTYAGRGRGGSDRGGYHSSHSYGYGQQPSAYGQQAPPASPYPSHQPQPQPGAYPPPQQQWHSEQHSQHTPQQPPAPPPPQGYAPSYGTQSHYPQAQQPYGQPAYSPAPQTPYGPAYAPPAPQASPPPQPWASHHQSHPQTPYNTSSRGGRGSHSDRSGPKGQMMGPPIRMGFDGAPAQPPAPAPYPPQSYGAPHGAPYAPAPYQPYPPPTTYMPPAHPVYDGAPAASTPRHGRGGHNNGHPRHRPQFGGDKVRGRNGHAGGHNSRGGKAFSPPAHHQKHDHSGGKKKKRKTNTLGLTPGDESDEDDENEEERLNEMIGADAPNPITNEELAAWIAERRANFPSKAKIEAKKAAVKAQTAEAKAADEKASLLMRQEQKAEKLRKQLEKVESSIKRKREQQDEGDEMRQSEPSSPSTISKSDDEKPEVLSTRPEENAVPPVARKADQSKHCKYYSTGGNCGKRGKCRFVHDPNEREKALRERELNGGKMTLQQRLLLNDKEQEDLSIIQALKYLQDKGAYKRKSASNQSSSGGATSNTQPQTTGPASLPPNPLKREAGSGLPNIPPQPEASNANASASKYPGWNLSGFGNTGVRPNDK
ncbi:hypothetical protein GE21DRAFT_1720 [Neurospora crassa]|uniref:C3H1-type domain-containing protein n=2 Tax=Neurospora crassa TaxID=5141 RepID=Q7SGF5_NEUCR|nr:hypothetical protein NCU00967 [Neurospora crassa OR74A]EAA35924.1 hypothetical protein NCU00967 [Neurospora crassa OR74A]KHE81143.1 hypothetical protein GE21DRAFT_1720 [Neurospora crassa]CAE76337.1 putative protein [Neurospora crassa]|eukprot:XP_965160.1 hypothetical protein NCU00967 [Neurospora crassa OR74A]